MAVGIVASSQPPLCPCKVFVCCVIVGCMLGTGCKASLPFGPGGVLLLHREWDRGTQHQPLHTGPRAILCRPVWAEVVPSIISATGGGGSGWVAVGGLSSM